MAIVEGIQFRDKLEQHGFDFYGRILDPNSMMKLPISLRGGTFMKGKLEGFGVIYTDHENVQEGTFSND